MHQIRFPLGLRSRPSNIAGFKAPTSKGREAKMEGRGRMDWRVEEKNEGPTTTKGKEGSG